MNKSINYSLIIPTKDRPEELRKCLQFVYVQKIKPEKYIIVDDGQLNPDEIRAWMGSEGERLIYHRKETPGLIQSLNVALELCPTEWMLILDDDVNIVENFMEAMADALYSYKEPDKVAGIAGYGVPPEDWTCNWRLYVRLFLERVFLLNGWKEGFFLPSSYCTDYYWGYRPNHPYPTEFIAGGLGFWRTDILKRYRFNTWYEGYAYGNDKEASYRISREHILLCQPAAVGIHRKSQHSRTQDYALGKMMVKNQFFFYRKTFKKHIWCFLFFAWALLGLVFIYLGGAIFSMQYNQRIHKARGILAGLWEEIRGQ